MQKYTSQKQSEEKFAFLILLNELFILTPVLVNLIANISRQGDMYVNKHFPK